jgi:hypothetical protein
MPAYDGPGMLAAAGVRVLLISSGSHLPESRLEPVPGAVAHFRGPGEAPNRADIEHCLGIAERMLSGRYVSVDQMVDWYEKLLRPPLSRLNEARKLARTSLEQHFPGAEAKDIVEAVEQLYPDE